MMRRFTSGAERLGARQAVHLLEFRRIHRVDRSHQRFRGAMAVAHAVVAAQVGAGFGRRDDVVHRKSTARCAAARRPPASRPASPSRASASCTRPPTSAASAAGKNSLGRPMRRPLSGCAAVAPSRAVSICAWKVLGRTLHAGGVAFVEAAHGRQQQRAVFGRARQRAGLVEAGRERDHAEARAHAVGRLDAGDAGEAGGLADRTAGVGARGGRHQAARPPPRPSRPTSRPARAWHPRDCAPGRRPSSRWPSPSRTRRS